MLTALAVDPGSLGLVFQGSTAKLLWQLFRRSGEGLTFTDDDDAHGRKLRACAERAAGRP